MAPGLEAEEEAEEDELEERSENGTLYATRARAVEVYGVS